MNSSTISVHWHDECQPIYSLHFQPGPGAAQRLATGGGDNNVRMWKIKHSEKKDARETKVEYLCTLRKHTQAVNAVRFDPTGKLLATASDDGNLIIWTLSAEIVADFGHQDDSATESWVALKVFTTGLEIYDLSWSPDSKYLLVACMDNSSKIYNIQQDLKVCDLTTHLHYVQGAAWDVKNAYVATLSADRSMHMYSIESSETSLKVSLLAKLNKTEQYGRLVSTIETSMMDSSTINSHTMDTSTINPSSSNGVSSSDDVSSSNTPLSKPTKLLTHLYYSETLQSFFRRLVFSPDGNLLLTPLGIYKHEGDMGKLNNTESSNEAKTLNSVYVYTRAGFEKPPICHITGLSKPAVAISFNPRLYKLSVKSLNVFSFLYKMVFAVATTNSVYIYDTELLQPLGVVNNLHYLTITDLCWDNDGQKLMVSSADGFCSIILFEDNCFGDGYISLSSGSDTDMNKVKSDGKPIEKILNPVTSNSKVSGTHTSTIPVPAPVPTASKVPANVKVQSKPTPIDKQSLISQFMAPPIVPKKELGTNEVTPVENAGEPKKKRVVPTLIQDYK